MDLGAILAICLFFGVITALVAQRKNLPVAQWFGLGAVLGVIALIIVAFTTPGLPKAPAGMRAVKCRRCNAVQNVPQTQRVYECWQCRHSNEIWALPASDAPLSVTSIGQVRCHMCRHQQATPLGLATFPCAKCGTKLGRYSA